MPLLLFRTMISADFHGAAPWALWAAYFSAVIVAWTAGHLVTTRLFRPRQRRPASSAAWRRPFPTSCCLAFPFMLGVFGQEGFEVLSLLVSVHLPTMMMASIILFELFGRSDRRAAPGAGVGRGFHAQDASSIR